LRRYFIRPARERAPIVMPMNPPIRFEITALNLDSALRYQRVIDLFKDTYRPDLAVLEVGSGSAGITEFLRHPVTGVDAQFERTATRHSDLLAKVRAAATRLPFADASYDVVLSVDMLEHVPVEDRGACLAEMLRVLRPGGTSVLAFPADESGERLDRQLNDSYRRRHNRDHQWLVEHIEYGLPRTLDVVALARNIASDAAVTITVHKHLWTPLCFLMHRIYTVGLPEWPGLWRLVRGGAPVLFRLARFFNFSPAYRTVLVFHKRTATPHEATA
jgi:SAM-dependent methyltransferase